MIKANLLYFLTSTLSLLLVCTRCDYEYEDSRSFEIDVDDGIFLIDRQPFQFVSGSLYYHRVPYIYWAEKVTEMLNLGINVVYSPIPWNYHCQDYDNCSFEDNRNIEQFLSILSDMNMLAVLKIGPYTEDKIQLGGLPPWLFYLNESMTLRSSDEGFVGEVDRWYSMLLPKLKPFLYENNGPIIMIQIEENYGAYDEYDPQYLLFLRDQVRLHLGESVIISTSDDYWSVLDKQDNLPYDGILMTYFADWKTTSGPIFSKEAFDVLDVLQPNKPWIFSLQIVCDYKENHFCKTDLAKSKVIESLTQLYDWSSRININVCLIFTGITYEFWNDTTNYASNPLDNPTVSDILTGFLSETSSLQEKHEKYEKSDDLSCEKVKLLKLDHLLFSNSEPVASEIPAPMEYFGQYQGFSIYSTDSEHLKSSDVGELKFDGIGGEGFVYTWSETDGYIYHGTIHKYTKSAAINMKTHSPAEILLILVENTGYNTIFDGKHNQLKGLSGSVYFNDNELINWSFLPVKHPFIDMQNMSQPLTETDMNIPGVIYTSFIYIENEEKLTDLFIEYDAFFDGIIYVNDNYVDLIRPTLTREINYTAYIPKTYLHVGNNTISLATVENLNNEQLIVCRKN
uniref:Glycoside hydrolase 35 catalytic domain-containing protein n=2 Tax=Trichobilharzia regenti TaxID=157069 RepID=A0AA85KMS4_TRIRE|nr:unnamed protein product [Trichobilharzia regenti]